MKLSIAANDMISEILRHARAGMEVILRMLPETQETQDFREEVSDAHLHIDKALDQLSRL